MSKRDKPRRYALVGHDGKTFWPHEWRRSLRAAISMARQVNGNRPDSILARSIRGIRDMKTGKEWTFGVEIKW